MKHEEAKKQFIETFNKKFPDFKIIKLTNISSEIIVEDENGFRYKKNSCFNALKYGFNIQSVIDKKKYIEYKIKEIHPNLTLITYHGMKERLLVEDENGFKYQPQCYDLLKGSKVSIETCTDKEGLFKFKANKKHNNYYNYGNFKYYNGKAKIIINCKIHGNFEQTIESHLSGRGCPKCGTVGFSKASWLKKVKGDKALFYILRVYNDNEVFIKFGITSKTINYRYRTLKNYKFDIKYVKEGSASEIYDTEKRMIKKYKCCKTIPKLQFKGYSECFDINCLNKNKNYENFSTE